MKEAEHHRRLVARVRGSIRRRLGTGQAADLAVPLDRNELIAYGPRLSDNGATRLGTVALVRRPALTRHAPDPEPVRRPWVRNWQAGMRS